MNKLEEGDIIERNNIDWIRSNIPEYEYIWSKFIGNDGTNRPLNISGLTDELKNDRETFYQAHYTLLRILVPMRDISLKYQQTLGQVYDSNSYIEIQNDLTLFMAYLGQIRDMFKKMDTALKLKGSVWKEYDEFYAKRDMPPKGVPLIEGKSLAKIKQIMQEIMYEKETIYRRADPRDT